MSKATTSEAEVLRLRQSVQALLRRRVLEAVELVLEEELTEALGTARYAREAIPRRRRNMAFTPNKITTGENRASGDEVKSRHCPFRRTTNCDGSISGRIRHSSGPAMGFPLPLRALRGVQLRVRVEVSLGQRPSHFSDSAEPNRD
jgi:hypothetical protein